MVVELMLPSMAMEWHRISNSRDETRLFCYCFGRVLTCGCVTCRLTGVLEVGLFVGMAQAAFFGEENGTVLVKYNDGVSSLKPVDARGCQCCQKIS